MAGKQEEIVAYITLEDAFFKAGVKSVSGALSLLSKDGSDKLNQIANASAKAGNSLQKNLARIDFRGQLQELDGVARGYLRFANSIVSATKNQEQYLLTLKTASGSYDTARKELALFQDEAKKSSFSVSEIVEAGAKLRSKGLGIEQSIAQLKQARDVAAATGDDIREISNFLGRARRGDQDALTVLSERGVVGKDALRKLGAQFDGTGAIKAVTSEQKKALNEALDTLVNRFAGADEERVKSIEGAVSNLKDSTERFAASIGETVSPAIQQFANDLQTQVEVFEKLDPATKKTIGQYVLIGGAVAGATIAFAALAGPIGTIFGFLKSTTLALVTIGRTIIPVVGLIAKLSVVAAEGQGAIVGIGSATIALSSGFVALAGPLTAATLGFAALAFEAYRSAKAQEANRKASLDNSDKLVKVITALGGLGNLGTTTAAELKKAGVSIDDVTGAVESLNEKLVDKTATEEFKARTRDQINQFYHLRAEMRALGEDAKGSSALIEELNKQEDPFSVDKAAKADLDKQLKSLDAEGASSEQRLETLQRILSTNELVQRDSSVRLDIETRITKELEKQARTQQQAVDKQLASEVKRANASGNELSQRSKNASQLAAKLPTGSESRKKLEEDALRFEEQANQRRINNLRGIIKEYNLQGDQRKNIEQKIFNLEQKNHNARIAFTEEETRANEVAARRKEELRKKEENDVREALDRQYDLQSQAYERELDLAKKRVEDGTGSQAEVEAIIRNLSALEEQKAQLRRKDEDAETTSAEARILNEQNAALEIKNIRDGAQDAIRDYDDSLKQSAQVAKETANEQVQAVESQVKGIKSALLSLEDIQKQQSDAFGIDAVRAKTDEIRAGRLTKESNRQAAFKKGNAELVGALAEADRREKERQRQVQQASAEGNRLLRKSRADEVLAKQSGRPADSLLTGTSRPDLMRTAVSSASPPVPTRSAAEQAAMNRAVSRTPDAAKVDVKVEVTVKDSSGRRMEQEGPAKVSIGGRGSDYETAAKGTPYASYKGGLSSSVGLG